MTVQLLEAKEHTDMLYVVICTWMGKRSLLLNIHKMQICFQLKIKSYCSGVQPCPILCNPIDWSMPGFPALHYLLELVQTHVYLVSDAIQPSHHLLFSACLQSFPVSGSFSVSQFFTSDGQGIETSASASVLPMNIQGWSPFSPRDSQEYSSTTVLNHKFFSTLHYL